MADKNQKYTGSGGEYDRKDKRYVQEAFEHNEHYAAKYSRNSHHQGVNQQ